MIHDSAATDRRPAAAWVGSADDVELAWVRTAVADLVQVREFGGVEAAVSAESGPFWPAVVLLGTDAASRWPLPALTAIARRWPLAPLVSVATSLVEGRRRSGPALPGAEEVPWNEVPVRLTTWLADRRAGRPGTLGLPATARREDRALEAVAALTPTARASTRVSVAADRPIDLEGLVDIVAASDREIIRRTCGRPPLDEPADVLVWDAGALGTAQLAWLQLLAANRPGLRVVVIDSFPRADTALAALRAGAAAVLGRPLSAESLAGALAGPGPGRSAGLGPVGRDG